MKKTQNVLRVSDSVSSRIGRALSKTASKKLSAFTLAELIVVVVVLAVLAAVGFLTLSGYSSDAKDSALKANVRSVSVAISAESASTGNSPRYYVVHDAGAALSGAFVLVDGNPVALSGGNWDVPGTNYSAGNPDYAKLKLNPDKFRVASNGIPGALAGFFGQASAAYDPKYLTVGAADVARTVDGKKRPAGWFQVAGISPTTSSVSVSGNYPAGLSGSVAGLVLDPTSGSSTGALLDGAKAGVSTGCASGTVNGYAVPTLAHLGTASVTKAVLSGTGFNIGTKTGNASCSFGTTNAADVSVSCAAGYVEGAGLSCVADVCGGTVADPNAHSTATSQTVSQNWARSATPGACTWDCNSGYGWDSGTNSCKASVNGTCGSAAKTYAYSAPSFGTDYYCANGGPSATPSFPAAGASVSWTCGGQWGGADSPTCTASRGSCAANPSFANIGALTVGNPATVGQAWTYSATPGICTYACAAGYSGTNCLTQSIVGNDIAGRTWADGSYATSCKTYRYPTAPKSYAGATCDGVYWIDPDGAGAMAAFKALCDMTTSGGGWTIIAESMVSAAADASLPFDTTWNVLKTAGVGTMTSPETNFHISMDRYLAMANASNPVEYEWHGKSGKAADPWQRTIAYSNHYLASDGYFTWNGTLTHAAYNGVAYNGMRLTTKDADNDVHSGGNCANSYGSFGWYTACHSAQIWSTTDERSTTCNPSNPYAATNYNQ